MWWDDVRKSGYPTNWTKGLFPAEALIGENGEMVPKPRRSQKTTNEKQRERNGLINECSGEVPPSAEDSVCLNTSPSTRLSREERQTLEI